MCLREFEISYSIFLPKAGILVSIFLFFFIANMKEVSSAHKFESDDYEKTLLLKLEVQILII